MPPWSPQVPSRAHNSLLEHTLGYQILEFPPQTTKSTSRAHMASCVHQSEPHGQWALVEARRMARELFVGSAGGVCRADSSRRQYGYPCTCAQGPCGKSKGVGRCSGTASQRTVEHRKQSTRQRIEQRVGRVRPFQQEGQPCEGSQCLVGGSRAEERRRMDQKRVGGRLKETTGWGAAVTVSEE